MKANRTFVYAKDDRAEVGVGTLIVFIAMVLVAAVAAAVLINTSGTLQERATSTGREATQEVSSNLKVVGLYGERSVPTGVGATDIDKLLIHVELSAGAPNLDLSKLVIRYSDKDNTYHFDDGTNTNLDGAWVATWIRGAGDNNVMKAGDLVELEMDLAALTPAKEIEPRTEVEIMLVPEAGSPVLANFKTPATYGDKAMVTLR